MGRGTRTFGDVAVHGVDDDGDSGGRHGEEKKRGVGGISVDDGAVFKPDGCAQMTRGTLDRVWQQDGHAHDPKCTVGTHAHPRS